MRITTQDMHRLTSAPRWAYRVFLLAGLGLLAGAAFAAWLEISFRQRAVEVDGRIVQMIRNSGTDSSGHPSTTWTAVFAFRLPDGTERRVTAGYSSSPPCCRVGEAVLVRYDPADPSDARMSGFMSSWFLTTLLGGMGLVFVLVTLLVRRMIGRAVRAAAGDAAAFGMPIGITTLQVPLVGLRREAGPGGPSWIVQARWIHPQVGLLQRLFESPPLPFDPLPQMRAMSTVSVTFDPADPGSAYAMDLSFLRAPGPQPGPVRRG